ncbi:MAG TPA: hypothetical protein ENH21_03235 [Chromatiales bacterium]|nr:hypothetical protein [Chromatiales bacterium]HEX22424.1 hypothetical protein [Chromatiales bacterium]
MKNDKVCTIHGHLYGLLCGRLEILDRVRDAQIYVVPSSREMTGDDVQTAKPAIKSLSVNELKAATSAAQLVLKDVTGEDGNFCLMNSDYQGGPVDVYVLIDRVPLPGSEDGWSMLPEPKALFLGTYVPTDSEEGWALSLTIPQSLWCRLKRLADAWTIIGKVTACANSNIALGGVTVTAFDVDWLQDDELGSGVTSVSGIYRIDYLGSKYRAGTFIDVELFGGPDIYFKIKDGDGNSILDELPSIGRSPGRRDREPCACIDVCAKVPVPEEDPGPIATAWTGVGIAFTIPDGIGLNDFDDDGYAGAAKYALTGVTRMTGSAGIKTGAGNPIEYRFRVSNTTAANTASPVAEASFTRIVGKSPDDNLWVNTKVCEMVRFFPSYKIVKVIAKQVDLDADGWLDVNKSIHRTFVERADVDPLDIPSFDFIDSDGMMAINTAKLTTEPDVSGAGLAPGEEVPAGDRISIEKFAIRFETREVINKATNTFGPMPGDGTTVNAFVMNNNPRYGKLAMKEHLQGTPCDVLTGAINAAYTVHHPHLRSVSLTVRSNDGVYSVSLNDPPMPLSGNTNPAITHLNNASLALPNAPPNVLHKCTYLVQLDTRLRLHTGDSSAHLQTIPTTFFWDPTP